MDFNRTEPTYFSTTFVNFLTLVLANKMQLFHILLRLAYIRGLILELSRNFQIDFVHVSREGFSESAHPQTGMNL